jgi:hypothetical protein
MIAATPPPFDALLFNLPSGGRAKNESETTEDRDDLRARQAAESRHAPGSAPW